MLLDKAAAVEKVETVVVGAGVVGLAVARALALSGREVVVLEAAEAFGTGLSSRNSEVVHAGIYYPAGSLKARLCVAGRRMLYRYCAARGVGHARCGKLIVASDEGECAALDALQAKAAANGVGDLVRLDARQAAALEPELRVAGALLSPSSGIVDGHALMLAFLADAEAAGAVLALHAPVEAIAAQAGALAIRIGGPHAMTLLAREAVNAAGLGAWPLARAARGPAAAHMPPRFLAKGSYFALAGRRPFSRLIYPLPVAGGLGIHATLDLAGRCRFGPDVEWVDEIDYGVEPERADAFYRAVRRYWPGLAAGALRPDYSGIRPKLAGPGTDGDFVVQGAEVHGMAGLIDLFGIESPGLTAAPALAVLVRDLLDGRRAMP